VDQVSSSKKGLVGCRVQLNNKKAIHKAPGNLVFVEQGALMSPNPSGKLEDLAASCVCVV